MSKLSTINFFFGVGIFHYRNDKYAVYVYKDSVHIPPLWMIDDCITFAHCGYNSIKLNAIINSHMAMKKPQLSEDKCQNIHVGKGAKDNCSLRINSKSLRANLVFNLSSVP